MANITLNIEGDLNIYVSEEDGQPDSLYLDGMDGCPETLRIHLEADGEDDESKAEVIYAIPGAAAISMTLYEALTLALNSGGQKADHPGAGGRDCRTDQRRGNPLRLRAVRSAHERI